MPPGPQSPSTLSPVPKEGPNGDGEREPGITFSPIMSAPGLGQLLMK